MDLIYVVALLGAAVVMVPIFKRLGLGSVLGYLAAGLAIGPFGLGLFNDPESILQLAELGVVLLLFVIGLELKPSRLWALRRDIFALGLAQVVVCGGLIFLAGRLAGLSAPTAFVAASGLAMSSTAIVMQLLEERGESTAPFGQRIFSILLFQDLAIVPLLAIFALLAPVDETSHGLSGLTQAGIAVVAVLGMVLAGRYVMNPIFRLLANTGAREIMTAAALLIVLGAAYVIQLGGLSMAMGAFLAGVLLSESSFRHQLEADIEPFRGLLLGLFFLGVGMSIDLTLVGNSWTRIAAIVITFMLLKAAGIYLTVRVARGRRADALRTAVTLAQGGEFAFVLFTTAVANRILEVGTAGILTASVIISMAVTPFALIGLRRLLPDREEQSMDGVEEAHDLSGTVLIVGFGRFGQVVSQHLLARGIDVTIIDADTDMIRSAARFGFKIYYGDGTRLDVLRAAGAGSARVIAVCVEDRVAADKIVAIAKAEFPMAALNVRSYDRGHTLDLIKAGVDYQIREVFESAMVFGEATLRTLGVDPEEAEDIALEIRRRDAERLELQMAGGLSAGRDQMLRGPTPTPLVPPRRGAKPLSEETAAVADARTVEPAEPAAE